MQQFKAPGSVKDLLPLVLLRICLHLPPNIRPLSAISPYSITRNKSTSRRHVVRRHGTKTAPPNCRQFLRRVVCVFCMRVWRRALLCIIYLRGRVHYFTLRVQTHSFKFDYTAVPRNSKDSSRLCLLYPGI